MIKKVLVCITIQENSRRLIKKGSEIAKSLNGELHILHVEKGMSIFEEKNAVSLLEELFELGKILGGEVHFVSDQDVVHRIINMAKELDIDCLVLGMTVEQRSVENNLIKRIKKELKHVNIEIVDRNVKVR